MSLKTSCATEPQLPTPLQRVVPTNLHAINCTRGQVFRLQTSSPARIHTQWAPTPFFCMAFQPEYQNSLSCLVPHSLSNTLVTLLLERRRPLRLTEILQHCYAYNKCHFFTEYYNSSQKTLPPAHSQKNLPLHKGKLFLTF